MTDEVTYHVRMMDADDVRRWFGEYLDATYLVTDGAKGRRISVLAVHPST